MALALNKSLSDSDLTTSPPKLVGPKGKKRKANIVTESTGSKDDITEMVKSMQAMMSSQQKEIKKIVSSLMDIKTTNANIESNISFLSEKFDELQKKMGVLEEKSKKDSEYIVILENKIEDLQREHRKSNIEIKNAPKNLKETKEELTDMFLCLARTVECDISKNNIKDIYRVQGKSKDQKNTPIVIETTSTFKKTEFIKKCKGFNLKTKDKLCAKHLGHKTNTDTPIFVSEQLTAKGARLYFLARELTKTRQYKFCWTSYGRVYVRETEHSPIITIKHEAQVHTLLSKNKA